MEHFIGISFCIATSFICLQARHLPIADASIPFMQSDVTCDAGSKFYTPTNVKAECMTNALECIKKELNATVKAECNGSMEYVDDAINFFKHKLEEKKRPAPSTSAECKCERWPQAPFKRFLEEVESLLQRENSSPPAQ